MDVVLPPSEEEEEESGLSGLRSTVTSAVDVSTSARRRGTPGVKVDPSTSLMQEYLGAVGSKKIGDGAADANDVAVERTARWRRKTTDLDDPASALAFMAFVAMALEDDDGRGVILLLMN
jgi:hypothetical protein